MFTLLIAEPCNTTRMNLKTFLSGYPQVTMAYEAVTTTETQHYLATMQIDLLFISSSLITDLPLVAAKRFVIVAAERDDQLLRAAFYHGGLGYLLKNTPLELFGMSLHLQAGQFLYDPTLASEDLAERSGGGREPGAKLDRLGMVKLTAREQEIFSLMRAGFSSQSIASALYISKETVKTHISHIYEKLGMKGRGARLNM